MSLESFFHEVALRQASADRDNLRFQPSWPARFLAALSPAAKRLITVPAAVIALVVVWWLHPPITQYLLDLSPHPPGAADILATVTHHAPPIERARRLVLACARENNAHDCQEALRRALTVATRPVVASWLKDKEVQALRNNAYFDQFADNLENHPDRLGQHPATPAVSKLQSSPAAKPNASTTQTQASPAGVATNAPSVVNFSEQPPTAPDHDIDYLLGPGKHIEVNNSMAPETSLDVSYARSANPSDLINAPPPKEK